MDPQNLIGTFHTWLKSLGDGEATLYGLLLTGFFAIITFFVKRRFKKRNSSAEIVQPQSEHELVQNLPQAIIGEVKSKQEGVAIGTVNGSPITVYNIKVSDQVAQLHARDANLPEHRAEQISRQFLADIENYHRYLPLKGLGDNAGLRLRFPLVELFIPLNARLTLPKGDTLPDDLRLAGRNLTNEEAEHIGGRLDEAQPILQLIIEQPVLVILGDPGSGKSTVVRLLAYLLATGQGDRFGMADYLPLLLPLAAYSEKLEDDPDLSLRRFSVQYFQTRMDLDGLDQILDARLNQGKVLILLDGLDEVKDRQQRNSVVERVQSFLSQHVKSGNRVVVTSRIIGYREVRPPEVQGLRECTLLDFDDDEISDFIRRWTGIVEGQAHEGGRASHYEAEREASELLEAIKDNAAIRKLGANPLLLTMLVIQKRQGIRLPRHRVILYEQYIVSLLREWLLARSLHAGRRDPPDDRKLRKVLEPLAWWLQESEPGKGLVNEADLMAWLRGYFAGHSDPDQAATDFVSSVREHSGLLLDRGGARFGFMHLTFMEYLAAVELAKCYQQGIGSMAGKIIDHAGEAEWRETILLAIGYLGLHQKYDQATTELLDRLLDKASGEVGLHYEIVAAALADMGEDGVTQVGWLSLRQKLIDKGLRNQSIPAQRRSWIGRSLSEMGDLRAEVLDVDAIQFCTVPEGSFFLGSTDIDGSGLHQLDYRYAISHYPVTVAQFRQFVQENSFEPGSARYLGGADNTPVVYVNWHEALAFCDWLTERWRRKGWLDGHWRVDLPSELEWEKAARGGKEIPITPELLTLSPGMTQSLCSEIEIQPNSMLERLFPWGDNLDHERMNSAMHIGNVSTVGAYPDGASPYAVEEMTGNVFEWTRSLFDDYPYPVDTEKRKVRESRQGDGPRVLRGGAFRYDDLGARCSARIRGGPDYRISSIGFRVVLSPLL